LTQHYLAIGQSAGGQGRLVITEFSPREATSELAMLHFVSIAMAAVSPLVSWSLRGRRQCGPDIRWDEPHSG